MGSCPDLFLYLENEHLKIGVDPARGGGVAWLSKPGGDGGNLLNEYDCGRFIQQSYYGRDDGSSWNGRPWRWNPVQGGSWRGAPARVLTCAVESPGHLVIEVHPCNWAGEELLEDVVMRSDISLLPGQDHVHIRATLTYSGGDAHPVRIQELPAVFVARRLRRLVFYDGQSPWTGGALRACEPGAANENARMPEGWAAWVDPDRGGEGVGVFFAGRVDADVLPGRGDDAAACGCASNCSYFAPTMRFSIRPRSGFSYSCFIALGTAERCRSIFSGVRGWAMNNRPEYLTFTPPLDATPAI